MAKKEAFLQFLKAARSLQDRGLSKEAIVQFAKNEFGELSELFKKQIDSLFKPKKGIENIKIKDEVFDDTVVNLPIDDTGQPFNPNNPLKQYGKKTIEGQMEKINKASSRLDELIKEREEMFKPKKPEDKATGGRAGYGLGNLVKGRSAVAVPGSAPVSSGSGNGLGGLLSNMVTSNPQMFTPVQNYAMSDNSILGPAAKNAASNIMEGQARNKAALNIFNQSTPKVDARMNLDYDTLISQNEAQRNLQAQRRNPGIVDPGLMKQASNVDPRAGIKEAFFNERLSGGERFGDAIPDFDKYGTYTGDDQLLKDYAAAGRGTPSSQLLKLPEGNPYAYGGPGYYSYDGTNFSKVGSNQYSPMTTEKELDFLRSQYIPSNLQDINQTGMPRAITQDDIDTFNFTQSDPMMTGFDYSKENNWSPGQPAPDGYRVANMLGDTYLERIYPSKQEIAGLPGMIGPMGPMPLGLMMPPSGDYRDLYREDPDAGLSGQEYAEKYGLEYASGGRAGYYTGGMVDVEPSLSDIGHGSDALMARTRLVSPGSQSTTSTGLNYLLAEDNDNIRVPFSKGKLADAARRKFMKAAGAGAAGLAALKTGLLGLGEKAAPVVETAIEAAKGVPPYFFQLVDLIKSKGREIESYGERVKQYISPSKDGKSELMLTEDLNTGDIQVKKIFKENDDMVTKSEEMNFTKGRGDESTKGTPADDYEEVTEYNSRIYKDEFNDPDVVDGINVEDITKELIETKTKKASGGIARMLGE